MMVIRNELIAMIEKAQRVFIYVPMRHGTTAVRVEKEEVLETLRLLLPTDALQVCEVGNDLYLG